MGDTVKLHPDVNLDIPRALYYDRLSGLPENTLLGQPGICWRLGFEPKCFVPAAVQAIVTPLGNGAKNVSINSAAPPAIIQM
jgi:hypothetical protein